MPPTCFHLTESIDLVFFRSGQDRCFEYAVQETRRLLGRLGVLTRLMPVDKPADDGTFRLMLATSGAAAELPEEEARTQKADGYWLRITASSASIGSRSAKGVLNGVYDLAGRLGFLFLLPGESGEWVPREAISSIQLPTGDRQADPRFEYRGVFWEPLNTKDHSLEEWLRFYAKLRFNALEIPNAQVEDCRSLAEELGLRLETGGHGLKELMPRELFEKNPELFRMFQPDDFGGQRLADSNCCITHPRTKQIIQKNYRKQLEGLQGVHALHCWADDLPAGGWCLCPSCRALTPSDQAMLAMRHLAEVAANTTVRVPVIAYHDTIFPGSMIEPSKECFLLFAPRERCYGHALDDESCARNRHYRKALDAWMQRFSGVDDAHTFEYYFDQILFRGLYPFLPNIIIEDMRVYEAAGITAHMSLQVAGPEIAPEFNMLVFAEAHWDRTLTAESFIEGVARRISPQTPEVWSAYLRNRAEVFTEAMAMCDHELGIYLDYRWLPETTHPFGPKMACTYADSSSLLTAALAALEAALQADWHEDLRALVANEVARARFEAAELGVMACQQTAMNSLGRYHNTGCQAELSTALASLEEGIIQFRDARAKAVAAGIGETQWYCRNINECLGKEFQMKLQRYAPFLPIKISD